MGSSRPDRGRLARAVWGLMLGCPLIGATLPACTTTDSNGEPQGVAGSAGSSGADPGGGAPGNAGSAGSAGSGGADPTPFCAQGTDVPGAVPRAGFCMREFARVPEARTLVVAPNGDLFVSSPSTSAPGGASGGLGQILVISDDDHNGEGEIHVFANNVPDVHGLAFGGGYLYFTSATTVYRTPYVTGQRAESSPREDLMMPSRFGSGRWTHGLALSVGGTLLASSGEYSSCGVAPTGSISQVNMGSAAVVASGFRNPMYLRCHYQDELCAANELGEDQATGAREKFIVIRPDTNYGYPCCFGSKQPVSSSNESACESVAPEDASFTLGDTPFGFDWEHSLWPAPYTGGLFVALHGSAYSSPRWKGAKVVFAATDPKTHLPMKDAWQEFIGGFGADGKQLARPSDITFAPDGRMFIADDLGNHVYWVAPVTLMRH